jgi:hypothetical protein
VKESTGEFYDYSVSLERREQRRYHATLRNTSQYFDIRNSFAIVKAMTTNAPRRYATDEERKEAKRESLRRFRAKEALLKKEGCKCSNHLEEELKTIRELSQAQSDRIQELEKLLKVIVTNFNDLEKNCVIEEDYRQEFVELEVRIGTLEAKSGKLPPRITK